MSDAKDDDDLNALFCDEFCCEVFQRCGITQTLKVSVLRKYSIGLVEISGPPLWSTCI